MRYIDTSSITVPNNWKILAVDTFNPLWSFFKKDFEAKFGKKCWYSESDNSGSVNPIDHFRPQGATVRKLTVGNADLDMAVWNSIDANKRTGYPFLIYDFSNYRYSCDITNSLNREEKGKKAKGKSNFFPLKKGSPIGTNAALVSMEEPCLLDPCIKTDPDLITFTETGLAEPHVSILSGSWEYCRVHVSIEIYHLHYYLFKEKRNRLWNLCKAHLVLANGLATKGKRNKEDKKNLKFHIDQLKLKIKLTEEFSAVAIDCIKKHKELIKLPWLDIAFPDALLKK